MFTLKSAKQYAIDPLTGSEAQIFNPRVQGWQEHFACEGSSIIGRTPIGRATVDTLAMNRDIMLAIRHEEALFGRYPPPHIK